MRRPRARAGVAVIAAAAVLGLGAACGDDGDEAAPVTVTERITVTDAAGETAPGTATDATTDTAGEAPELPPGAPTGGEGGQPPPPGDPARPSDADIDAAVRAYRQIFDLPEAQARCLVERAIEISELNADDPSAILAAGGLEIFRDCGIDLTDLAGRFGARP